MGELGIGITDLGECDNCGHILPFIFQTVKGKWWVACAVPKCEHKTKEHKELLDAADAWGLREAA
jgi:hypothetical protein